MDRRAGLVEVCRAPGKTRRVRDVIEWHVPAVDVDVAVDLAEVFVGI